MTKEFGSFLRAKRLEEGISVEELSRRSRFTSKTINGVEEGAHNIRPYKALRLARELGLQENEYAAFLLLAAGHELADIDEILNKSQSSLSQITLDQVRRLNLSWKQVDIAKKILQAGLDFIIGDYMIGEDLPDYLKR